MCRPWWQRREARREKKKKARVEAGNCFCPLTCSRIPPFIIYYLFFVLIFYLILFIVFLLFLLLPNLVLGAEGKLEAEALGD
jgi:hypothetical protein